MNFKRFMFTAAIFVFQSSILEYEIDIMVVNPSFTQLISIVKAVISTIDSFHNMKKTI